MNELAREDKKKNIKAKTPALRLAKELKLWLLRKLCNEKVFPKRSRWLVSGKIADLTNDFANCVRRSNEIKVVTQQEWGARHYWLTMAIANLMTLDAAVTDAVEILEINPNDMTHYSDLANDCRAALLAWLNSDEKRYGSPPRLIP